jgi:hypothetical protein
MGIDQNDKIVSEAGIFDVGEDPQLGGAIIEVAASGTLGILPQENPNVLTPSEYSGSTSFRVATDKEVMFADGYTQISNSVDNLGWLSWPTFVAVIAGIFFATPSACRKCMKIVNRMRIYNGHLCRECFDKDKADKAAAGTAA